jgi:transcriptional regulator
VENKNVLEIFHGPHCYISPSRYITKLAVPTWNYVAIHVYGLLEIVEDEHDILNSLLDMVNEYEKTDSPYQLKELDSNFIEGMSRGMVGFIIKITKIEGKAKLRKNQPEDRQKLVIKELGNTPNENNKKIFRMLQELLSPCSILFFNIFNELSSVRDRRCAFMFSK